MKARLLVSALTLGAVAAAPIATARAGGMYLPVHGVRATGRGGAFIAGADDLSAMWLNPAGLAHLRGGALLLDATFVHQAISYDRIDSGGNSQATVDNQAPGLPVPSLGYARALSNTSVLAVGVSAPYAGLAKWDVDGPQRYSSVDLSKSVIAVLGVGVALRLGPALRLGATLQNHVTALQNEIVLQGCPGETICAPEDPDFDSVARIDQDDFFNPSGAFGIQYDAADAVTVGASLQLPVWFRGQGKVHTRLPRSGFFDGASVEGNRADISFDLPAEIRAGIEYHSDHWRVEAATTIQLWSQHDAMRIEPHDVRIVNAAGVGTYELGPMVLPRKFKDTYAAHLGAEHQLGAALRLRAGYVFETGAPPDAYLSVLTVDGQKHLLTAGAGYQVGKWIFDAVVGYGLMAERHVDPRVGLSPELNPIRDTSAMPLTTYVNWGDYRSSWLLLGLGFHRSL